MLPCRLQLASAPKEPAETEVAVGDEGTHAAFLGQRECLAVVCLAALGIEPVGMRRNVAEQVEGVGRMPALRRKGFDRTLAVAPRHPHYHPFLLCSTYCGHKGRGTTTVGNA